MKWRLTAIKIFEEKALFKVWQTIEMGSVIPELQNQIIKPSYTYDVTSRVTNSKFFLKIFRVSNSMWKKTL